MRCALGVMASHGISGHDGGGMKMLGRVSETEKRVKYKAWCRGKETTMEEDALAR